MEIISNKHGPFLLLHLFVRKLPSGEMDDKQGEIMLVQARDGTPRPRDGTHSGPPYGRNKASPGGFRVKIRDGTGLTARDWPGINIRDGNQPRSRDGTNRPPGQNSIRSRCGPAFHWREARWKNRLLEPDRERYALTGMKNEE